MACLECRRRRIRCDGGRPKCNHCSRLSKTCEYDPAEQRRGVKKRSVKELEARLATVEARLSASTSQNGHHDQNSSNSSDFTSEDHSSSQDTCSIPPSWHPPEEFDFSSIPVDFPIMDDQNWPYTASTVMMPLPTEFEQTHSEGGLPTLLEIEELNKIFFDIVHPSMLFLRPHRFSPNAFLLAEDEPPLCLKYAVWSLAAFRDPKYADRVTNYYQIARAHLDHDEMQGDGSGTLTLAHVQAWLLVTAIEAEGAVPARAWMSNRRANALSSMLGLHCIDGPDAEKFTTLKVSADPAEIEERRRTFWYLFVCDRWGSIGTGKSVYNRMEEIHTYLPISDDALSNPTETRQTITDATNTGLGRSASPLTASVVTARTLEKIMQHLRKAEHDMGDTALDDFWLRHEQLDNEITQLLLTMPDHLRPASTQNPWAFFANMCLHEFTISLFTAALVAAQKSPAKADMLPSIQLRTRRAAEEVINIMKAQSYMSIQKMTPFTPSCLYVAASVFVKAIKQGDGVAHAMEVLRFIVQITHLFGRFYRSGQMFLAQLLLVMKKNKIELGPLNLEGDPTAAGPKMNCDFEFMGLLWSTELFLRDR